MQSFAKGLSHKRIRRQSGSVAMLGALWLMIAVICLATIDIGNVFWQKRELQKIADLAALAGASQGESECLINGGSIAEKNGLVTGKDNIEIKCGNWSLGNSGDVSDYFIENKTPFNASKVFVSRNVAYFFVFDAMSSSRRVEAVATAKQNSPVASLSIRSTLATVNSAQSDVLNFILGKMLGSTLNLSAVGWDGIAKSKIDLLEFLKPLIGGSVSADVDLGNYESLLNTEIGIGKVISAMIGAVRPGEAAQLGISALENIFDLIEISDIKIKLIDILKIDNGIPLSTLDVGVNALDMIQALAQVGAKSNAAKLDLNLDTLGLADVSLALRVIEPAQISVTGNPEFSKIEVRTAQIRVLTSVSSKLLGFLTAVVNGLLGVLNGATGWLVTIFGGTSAHVQILASDPLRIDLLIDAARGYARVEHFQCGTDKYLDIYAEKSAVDIYVGTLGGSKSEIEGNAFGMSIPNVSPIPLLDVGGCKNIMGCDSNTRLPYYFGGVSLGGHSKIISQERRKRFYADQLKGDKFDDMGFSNIDSVYGKVADLKIINSVKMNSGDDNLLFKILENVTNKLLPDLLKILSPITKLLDVLLSALGIGFNKVEVSPRLICGGDRGVSLVY